MSGMSDGSGGRAVLHLVVCAGGAAPEVHLLAAAAVAEGWDVWVVPTPSAVDFVDVDQLAAITGHPARARWRRPGESGSLPPADAAVVAPATFNTVNKWAAGIADTYALGRLAEATGRRVPVVVMPFVNQALAANTVYGESLARLRRDGVLILDGTADADGIRRGVAAHPAGTFDVRTFPWTDALRALDGERPDLRRSP
jgi:phosphopantothenoylcysteine synthetase/decarboxylase